MRTTLKRGIGRGAVVDGNGRAVLPPAILGPAAVTRYRQPDARRRSHSLILALIGVLLGVLLGGTLLALVATAIQKQHVRSSLKAIEKGHLSASVPVAVAVFAVAFVVIVTVAALLLARRESRRNANSTFWRRVALVVCWLCAGAFFVDAGSGGGTYLYYHQSVAAVAAHSKDVKLAAKHLDIPLPNHPAIALVP